MKKYYLLLASLFACGAVLGAVESVQPVLQKKGQNIAVCSQSIKKTSFISRHYLLTGTIGLGSLALVGYYLSPFWHGRDMENLNQDELYDPKPEVKETVDIQNLDVEEICKDIPTGKFQFNKCGESNWAESKVTHELDYLRSWSESFEKCPSVSKDIVVLQGPMVCDVSQLESDEFNNGAAFQVASNGNAYCSIWGRVVEPKKLFRDRTQEAYAILPTLPAAKVRYDAVKDSAHKDWQDSSGEQISLLVYDETKKSKKPMLVLDKTKNESTEHLFKFKNGYVAFNTSKLEQIEDGFEAETYVQLCAYHKDAPVVLKKAANGTWYHEPKSTLKVDHIISAAVNLGENVTGISNGYCCGKTLQNNKDAQAIAQKVLETSYEHAILLAAFHKKKKLYLTLLGGGVFENKRIWILRAIIGAVEKHKHILGDMQIFIVDFNGALSKFINSTFFDRGSSTFTVINNQDGWKTYKKNIMIKNS